MICCSSWCHRKHGAAIGSVETKEERGDPGSLKENKKHWFPFHALNPFLKNHFKNFPALHSATLGSFSGYENPWTVLYVFSLMISCHTFNLCRKKGGWGGRFVVRPWPRAYTFCLRWVTSTRSEAVHSPKPTFSCWSGLKISTSQVLESRRNWFYFQLNALWKKSVPVIRGLDEYVQHLNWQSRQSAKQLF